MSQLLLLSTNGMKKQSETHLIVFLVKMPHKRIYLRIHIILCNQLLTATMCGLSHMDKRIRKDFHIVYGNGYSHGLLPQAMRGLFKVKKRDKIFFFSLKEIDFVMPGKFED